MLEEIWKDIEGYEGLYKISNYGMIIKCKNNRRMRLGGSSTSALTVSLTSARGASEIYRVADLVAQHFIPNPNNYVYVIHINGHKQCNRADNLKWVSEDEYKQTVKRGRPRTSIKFTV